VLTDRSLHQIAQEDELAKVCLAAADGREQGCFPDHCVQPNRASIVKPSLALAPDADEVVELVRGDHGRVGPHDGLGIAPAGALTAHCGTYRMQAEKILRAILA
jgi:hypothetical protein